MLSGLMLTAFLMGLAGAPHCAAMCGAPCAAAFPRGVPGWALVGRMLGYAVLGGVAAASAGALASLGRQLTVLQPFWLMAQFGAVLFGVWLAWQGRVPAWVDRLGQDLYHRMKARTAHLAGASSARYQKHVLAFAGGTLWAFMPCGLLYGALMVAVLAAGPLQGALVMGAFAAASTVGVWAAPALLSWLAGRSSRAPESRPAAVAGPAVAAGGAVPVMWIATGPDRSRPSSPSAAAAAAPWVNPRWALRVSGIGLASMAAWGLSHHLLAQWQAWCA